MLKGLRLKTWILLMYGKGFEGLRAEVMAFAEGIGRILKGLGLKTLIC